MNESNHILTNSSKVLIKLLYFILFNFFSFYLLIDLLLLIFHNYLISNALISYLNAPMQRHHLVKHPIILYYIILYYIILYYIILYYILLYYFTSIIAFLVAFRLSTILSLFSFSSVSDPPPTYMTAILLSNLAIRSYFFYKQIE